MDYILPSATCFFHVSVILSTGGVWPSECWDAIPPPEQAPPPPPSRHPLSPADGYCCRRYASYWNEFLFIEIIGNSTGQVICTDSSFSKYKNYNSAWDNKQRLFTNCHDRLSDNFLQQKVSFVQMSTMLMPFKLPSEA